MKNKGILTKVYIALIMVFMYAPIAVLIFYSFNKSRSHSSRYSGHLS